MNTNYSAYRFLRTFKSGGLVLLAGLCGFTFNAAGAVNACLESGPHYLYLSCNQSGTNITSGSLTYTNLNTITNWPVDPPTWLTLPTFSDGSMRYYITNDCAENWPDNKWVTNIVHYYPGPLYFTPTFTNGIVYTNAGTNTYTAYVDGKPTSLIGWWPAEGSTIDVVGGNSATLLNNVGFTAGMVGQAFNFAGSNCARITYSSNLISPNFTVEAWVKPTTQVSGQKLIFAQAYGFCQLVVLPGTNGVKVEFHIAAASGGFPGVTATNEISIGSYSHLAGTWDGTNLKIYINGVLRGQSTPGSTPIDSQFGFYVGGFNITGAGAYSGQYFPGAIDELSVYNCALSGSDIQTIYNTGSAGKQWTNLPPSCVCSTPVTTTIGTVKIIVTNGTCTPPAIAVQPTNVTLCVGSSATFSATVTGTASLKYQWYFNTNTALLNGTNSTLTVDNVQTTSAGSYQVVITNNCGAVTSSLEVLTVLQPPSISTQPTNVITCVNSTGNFSIDATGTGLEYQWQISTNEGESFSNVNTGVGGNSDVYTTPTLTTSGDMEQYRVLVSGSCGWPVTSSVVSLTVITSAFVTLNLDSQSVEDSSDISFDADATGCGDLSYQWQHDGINISGATNKSLILSNVQVADEGDYTVIVGTAGGSVAATASLLVNQHNVDLKSVYQNQMWDVDLGSLTSSKVGFAATGISSSDYWNPIEGSGTVHGLQTVNNSTPHISITTSVSGTPGRLSTSSGDDMYDTYEDVASPYNHLAITLTDLPYGTYDLYLYSKGANFKVSTPGSTRSAGGGKVYNPTPTSSLSGWKEKKQFILVEKIAVTPTHPYIEIYTTDLLDIPATISGLQLVRLNPLWDVDFGGTISHSKGLAVAGRKSDDFWNFQAAATAATTANLQTADKNATGVSLSVANLENSYNMGLNTSMYNTCIDSRLSGSSSSISINQLPTGTYDLYVYGPDCSASVSVDGGASVGSVSTFDPSPGTQGTGWNAGVNYSRIPNIAVTAGQPMDIAIDSVHSSVSGLQLLQTRADVGVSISSDNNPACFGDSVTLTARVTANQGFVQFYDGRTPLGKVPVTLVSGYYQASLTKKFSAKNHTIKAVYSSDGYYTAGTSPDLIQTVNKLPIIQSPPQDQTVCVGSSATFNVSADATYAYQWQVSADGVTFNDVNSGSGGTTELYTTPPLTAADSGKQYRCKLFSAPEAPCYGNYKVTAGATAFVTGGDCICILSPRNNASINTERINVSGTFTKVDVSRITVNGVPAFINGNTYEALNVPLTGHVIAIAAGLYHNLALRSDATVVGWGDDTWGQITPPAGLNGVVAIAAGGSHSLALKDNGTVAAWGNNESGQTTIPAGLDNVSAVAAGDSYSLALKRDGTVVAWGSVDAPPVDLDNVVAIAAGAQHCLALKNNGEIIGWGDDTSGQATPPTGLNGVVAIAAGDSHSLALRSDGTVVGWGNYNPDLVPDGLGGVVAIAAGIQHCLALKNDGTVVAWGWDYFGQGSPLGSPPAGLTGVIGIAGGGYAGLALKNNGVIVGLGETSSPTSLNCITITAVAEGVSGDTLSASITVNRVPDALGNLIDPVQLTAMPVGGFAPLTVTLTPQAAVPGTLPQIFYDFTGDNSSFSSAGDLTPITHPYNTAGEFFPTITIQTTVGRFSSLGGWNAGAERIRINVQAPPELVGSAISITDPVDIKVVEGKLYILSRSTATIFEYDSGGTLLRSLAGIGSTPTGLDADNDGNVYVALSGNNQVAKYNPIAGSFQLDNSFDSDGLIGSSGSGNGQFNTPYDVAVSPDETEIAVSDSGNHRIQRFNATSGAFLGTFGSSGSAVGQFNTPKGLTYDSAGNLYIVDSGNDRIALATSGVVGTSSSTGNANLGVGTRGIYVADGANNRVLVFDPIKSGHGVSPTPFTTRLELSGQFSPVLSQPRAIASIPDFLEEKIYIADNYNGGRVIKATLPETTGPVVTWNAMKAALLAGNIDQAVPHFSTATAEDYRRSFISIGTAALSSVMDKTLIPAVINGDNAQYYFEDINNIIPGQTLTFPVEFVKENGVWKILEF